MTASTPPASEISIEQTLALLDGPFSGMADGVARGLYTFWVGAGISMSRVEGLKEILLRVLDFMLERMDETSEDCPYRVALDEVLAKVGMLKPEEISALSVDSSAESWPDIEKLLVSLSAGYSKVLDVRVGTNPPDYLLWDGVNVTATYDDHLEPDVTHLCLGILVVEGAVSNVVSANWDFMIESAIQRLTDGTTGALQICIRSHDFSAESAQSRLLKFHGCAESASKDETTYRRLLIGRQSQITQWPTSVDPDVIAMRGQLAALTASQRTLMIGMSAQDSNIQHVFSESANSNAWTWPDELGHPAHVFAEDSVGVNQQNILRTVYGETYDSNPAAMEHDSTLSAFGEPLLLSLALFVVCSKFCAFVQTIDSPLTEEHRVDLAKGLLHLRDLVAKGLESNRFDGLVSAIKAHGRLSAIFTSGIEPESADLQFRPLSAVPVHRVKSEPTLATSGVRELAAGLALLGRGDKAGAWSITTTGEGSLQISSNVAPSTVYFFATGGAAIHMQELGRFDPDDADAVAIYSGGRPQTATRAPSSPPGRVGRSEARAVHMGDLLRASGNTVELEQQFREASLL